MLPSPRPCGCQGWTVCEGISLCFVNTEFPSESDVINRFTAPNALRGGAGSRGAGQPAPTAAAGPKGSGRADPITSGGAVAVVPVKVRFFLIQQRCKRECLNFKVLNKRHCFSSEIFIHACFFSLRRLAIFLLIKQQLSAGTD